MRSVFLAFLGVVLTVLVPVAGAADGSPQGSGERTPPAPGGKGPRAWGPEGWADAQPRHPLLGADPQLWLPVLLETRSFSETVETVQGRSATYYEIVPLGDADKDGVPDYALARRVHNLTEAGAETPPDAETLEGVSGATHATLWTRPIPSNAYWFELGDIDLDGVNDFAVDDSKTTLTAESVGAVAASRYRYVFDMQGTYSIVAGATGRDLFTHPWKGQATLEVRRIGVVAVATQFVYDVSFVGVSPVAPGVQAGVDVVRYALSEEITYAFAFLLFASSYYVAETQQVERFDANGKSKWVAQVSDAERTIYDVDHQDYTGDGVPDVLYMGLPRRSVYAEGVSADVTTDGAPVSVILLDGASGKLAWTYKSKPFLGNAFVTPGGAAGAGQPRSVLVHLWGRDSASPAQFQTLLVVLDGAKGAVAQSRSLADTLFVAFELADVDGDGASEWASIRAPFQETPVVGGVYPRAADLSVVKRDLTPLWTKKAVPLNEIAFLFPLDEPDFDGDGVPDLTLAARYGPDGRPRRTVDLQVLGGATGAQLWQRALDARTPDIAAVDDVDGAGGMDLVFTVFDVPEDKLASGTTSYSWDFDRDPLNYAPYPGRVELRRGSDAALVWSALVHDAEASGNRTLVYPYSRAFSVPDMNRDGVRDLLYTLVPTSFFSISCDSSGCTQTILGDDETLVNLAVILSTADGRLLRSYPAAARPIVVQAGPVTIAATPAEAASRDPGLLPGFETALLAVGALGALWRRRRHA